MRYLLLLLLLSLSFSFVAAQDAAQDAVIEFTDHPARVVTNINALNMRSSPAIEADNIVGRLQPGQQVHVIARDGGWQQVRREDGLVGWSHSDYLIDMPPRQIGETRLFRIDDEVMDTAVLVNAELRHIGKHSYIYVAEHPRQDILANLYELRAFAEVFDEHIYPETIALWAPDTKPSHEGDERVVILFTVGYQKTATSAGFYHRRGDMPGELNPYRNRTGFLEITWHNGVRPDFILYDSVAHELQHLTQHHFDVDEHSWVNEGFSVFNSAYLGYLEHQRFLVVGYQDRPNCQLTQYDHAACDYGGGFLFAAFILEQLGLDALRDFVKRPENGLAAMDALLAERGGELDTETFFANWVLANYLLNPQLSDGRFGYQLLRSLNIPKPFVKGRVNSLPSLIQESLKQYATDYYEIALPDSDQSQALELALQFPNSAAQDGWLQLVQVVDGEVILQRFLASDYRSRMIHATLQPNTEQAFLAISPFRANARYLTAKQPYTLKIHLAGSEVAAADYATSAPVETSDRTETIGERSPTQLAIAVTSVIHEYAKNRSRLLMQNKYAVIDQYVASVKELLAAGADMSKIGGLLLITVVKSIRSPELLTMLLDAGANPNTRSGSFTPGVPSSLGFPGSPLNYAVFFEDVESVRLLLAAGASPNSDGRRAAVLHLAAIDGNIRIIEMLLVAGADPAITDWSGKTAADLARQYGHHAAVQMIEAAATN